MEWRRSSERGLEVEDLGCSEEKSARWVWRWVSLTPAMDHLPFKWWTVGISSSRRELRTWRHTLIGSASAADSFGFMLLLLCEYVSCDVSEKELTVQNIETANRTDRTVREKERGSGFGACNTLALWGVWGLIPASYSRLCLPA